MLPTNRVPSHPGEILLEDFLKPSNITQQAFAIHMKWTFARVNEIVNGKRGISAETALGLSEAFGTTPGFWLNLQSNWELWHAKQEHFPVTKLLDVKPNINSNLQS